MEENRALIERFYTAFNSCDAETMAACYTDNAVFTDPAFGTLHGEQIRDMWRMLSKLSSEPLKVTYADIQTSETEGSVKWIGEYIFTITRRKVVNHVSTTMEFKNGKIIRQRDHFSFYTWTRQALGLVGTLIGWFPPVRLLFQLRSRSLLRAFEKPRTPQNQE